MPLDRRRLDDLVEYLGRDTACEMIGKATNGLDRNMRDLRSTADAAIAQRIAHTIKGLAAIYGLDDLAAAALVMETAASGAVGARNLADLERHVSAAKQDLVKFLRELPAPY